MNNKAVCILIACFTLLEAGIAFPLYDNAKSNVVNLNLKNWDTQIAKNRSKSTVSFIHFYKKDDLKSNGYKSEIDLLAQDYDGMFKFAAVDCQEFRELCEKQDVREFPTFKIYPPLPAPVFPYEGEISAKKIIVALGVYVENKAVDVHSGNFDSFISEKANLPKVFLFTDKAGVPLIYKVIAVQFDKKMNFGIIRKDETSLLQKYKVKDFPKIMVIPVGAKKPEFYDKTEYKFKPIFDFINIYSETFHKVGEDKVNASDSTKEERPWLNEKLPEMTEKSGNDICFKAEGVICLIIVSNGKPENKISELVSELQNYLSPKIDYAGGIKYKFGWVDLNSQTNFVETVGVSTSPSVVLINPGKRKRFYVLEKELNMDNLKSMFDSLASGDLRFKMFSGNNFPELK